MAQIGLFYRASPISNSLKGYVGGSDFDRNTVDSGLASNEGKAVNVLIDSLGGSLATDVKFSIRCMYIEEHFGPEEDSDTALLDLMIDRNQCEGNEDWHPNPFTIRRLAEQFSRMLCITKSDLN